MPSVPEVLEGHLTPEELAKGLKKSKRTLDRWEAERIGPPRVLVGNTPYYRIDSVRQWLESREQRRTPRKVGGSRE